MRLTYSQEAADLWNLYVEEFRLRWGMDREVAAIIGARSKTLFSAEYQEHGDDAYRSSVALPIRNAFYAAAMMHARWGVLKEMSLEEPILDYGCGVGMQLLWLKKQGFDQLYGYEIPGIQREVMASVFQKNGIREWNGERVKTVLCTNVLEHVANPVALLESLFRVGGRVIANICTDHDSPHIAPHDQLEICRQMLTEQGTLYHAA